MLCSSVSSAPILALLLEEAAHSFHQFFMDALMVPWIDFLASNGFCEPNIDCRRAGITNHHGQELERGGEFFTILPAALEARQPVVGSPFPDHAAYQHGDDLQVLGEAHE